MNLIEELRWRGMLHDIIPGTEEKLAAQSIAGYIGFDPTAPSLHVGSFIPIMLLCHMQRHGHKPIALVGGATGMIGDPSGKSEERKFLSKEDIDANVAGIKAQLSKFLSFEGDNAAEIVNNADWFGPMTFLDFMRNVGKHLSINYMLAKDSVQKRLETGISFTEFSYQLVQGYDFFHLYTTKNCVLQAGGSDQWGNITAGTEFIRRKAGGEAYAFTCPLLTKADGSKFGKSEQGNVWLDPSRTSPYKFYQYFINVADEDAGKLLRMLTFMTKDEIEALEAEHAQAPHLRPMQKALAKDLTTRVHSADDYEQAVEASNLLFGKGTKEALVKMDSELLESVMEGVPRFTVAKTAIEAGINVLDLLAVDTQIFPSKGEARKMVQGGGVSLNKEKLASPDHVVTTTDLLNNRYLLIQRGKTNYYLVVVE